MDKFTTEPRPAARSPRRARGNGFEPGNYGPRMVEQPSTRACATCGASLEGRRPQTRYCSPTCRAVACDERHGRTRHVNEGKRPRRAREV